MIWKIMKNINPAFIFVKNVNLSGFWGLKVVAGGNCEFGGMQPER